MKKFFLHISYYNDGTYNHRYYTGAFYLLRDQLTEMVSEDLPETLFEFQSIPFAGIEVSRYVKLL